MGDDKDSNKDNDNTTTDSTTYGATYDADSNFYRNRTSDELERFTREQEYRIKQRIYDDLEETYNGIDRRKNDRSIKGVLLSSIFVWAPLLVALANLTLFIGYAWLNDQKVALLQGIVSSRANVEADLKTEIQIWQAHTIVLQTRMVEHGIEVPDAPKPGLPIDNDKSGKSDKSNKSRIN